jgi:O-antigen/teichoic acid export membrane protein
VTVVVIACSFTPELQGFYYTFISILTLQTLLELGLGAAIQQIVSHEWACLRWRPGEPVDGDPDALDRLSTVTRFAFKWYTAAGVLALFGFTAGGYLFFAFAPETETVAWKGPWLIVSVITGCSFFLSFTFSILEGCNQVKAVYGFRVIQGLAFRLALWAAMLAGGGLWALVIERGVTLLFTMIFLFRRYSGFFRDLLRRAPPPSRFWQKELWPLQWRFAVVWISGFLPMLFIPALFASQGPEMAGRLGMTWALVTALVSLSAAIMQARMPRLAILIAKKAYTELDLLFRNSLSTLMIIVIGGAALVAGGIHVLYRMEVPLAYRFLTLPPTLVFLASIILQQAKFAMGTYLRAHKREPYLSLSVIEAVLLSAALFPLSEHYGVMGLACGFLVVNGVIFVPAVVIFRQCRRLWHGEDD